MIKNLNDRFPGFTITICFGKYSGFYIRNAPETWGVCLGWMAITFYYFDQEEAVKALLNMENDGKQKQN